MTAPNLAWLSVAIGAVALGATAWSLSPEHGSFDPAPLIAAAERYDVRILRDDYGVPHIYGPRDADVAYGLAYAHSEDDFRTIQQVVLAARGRLASVEGRSAAPLDYLVAWFGVSDRSCRDGVDRPLPSRLPRSDGSGVAARGAAAPGASVASRIARSAAIANDSGSA